MKINVDKALVVITSAVAICIAIIVFFEDLVCPKQLKPNNGLIFGNKESFIQLILFEDFQCKHCKKYTIDIFPEIKEYIETNKISYCIIPLAFMNGSKIIANAAIAVYELNREKFFEFLKIISEQKLTFVSKQDMVDVVKNLEGIDIKTFKELLDQEVFNQYLKDNLIYARKIIKPAFQVPTMYLNGNKIKIKNIKSKIEEFISYDGKYD